MTGHGWDLRIMAWNLWELRGDLVALIEAVEDLAPDVLLVQEAPRFVLPTLRLQWLARRLDRRILVGGGGGRGLAILATDAVAAQVIRRGAHPVAQTLSDLNSTYPRGVAAVRLSVPGGGAVVVSSIHFALQQDNRLAHAEHVAALVRGAGAPVIIGGDLNETADGAARTLLEPLLHDPAAQSEWTFPAARPQRRIDAVLTTPDVRVRAARAVTATTRVPAERLAGASDHLPTLLDVTL
ncbi:endonuclease/exonuclease/phosphatase family protein [Brachybacterium sp. J144]|uniref:endonuclease/exonuclease/phosphatase family protein n=1 Tax=unclassified Brachybacterium TaxID=2623841 RepID=UPI002E783345|nr:MULTISPECIES: endonuclease/exonuclease/phosphatase family protein [unclassified Brachybacterium]MEE1619221.1 endonuclease/exonuclease/phosphatase family protein [Brachybacterium sp. J153]MEE1649335.1 endonuclease/exonuclease/phosphatase family protein [Brachybacterium sp. J144]